MTYVKFPKFIIAISYRFWRMVTRIVAWWKFRLKVYGKENVPRKGPLIVAANHISWLDPPLVGAYCPRQIRYMAKKELFEIPWAGFMISSMGAYPVDRQGSARAAVKQSLDILKDGGCVGIFPEGGRNVEGDKQAQIGVSLIASLSGAPVVPCAVIGSKGTEHGEKRQVKVVYGKALSLPTDRKVTREDLGRFTDEIMAAIAALYEIE
jgi:1-acyl-sn-glycerol-3-phosphate acyltransferase